MDLLDYLRFLTSNRRFIFKALIFGVLIGIGVILLLPTSVKYEFQIGMSQGADIQLMRTSFGSSYLFVDYCVANCQIESFPELDGLSESQKIKVLHNLFHKGLSINKFKDGFFSVSLELPVGLVDEQFSNRYLSFINERILIARKDAAVRQAIADYLSIFASKFGESLEISDMDRAKKIIESITNMSTAEPGIVPLKPTSVQLLPTRGRVIMAFLSCVSGSLMLALAYMSIVLVWRR